MEIRHYSIKKHPDSIKNVYKLQFIAKTERFLKRVKSKTLAFPGNPRKNDKETKSSPTVLGLENFENDLMLLIKNI